MNHYTILGCDDNVISMLFEILSTMHAEEVVVDIVKNVTLSVTRHPYKTGKIKSSEIDADNWSHKGDTNYLFGVVKPSSKNIVHEYFSKRFSINDENFASLIHKDTSLAQTAMIQNGVIINPGVVIAPYANVNRYVFINRNVSIGHHSTIGEYAQVNPAVNVAGHCNIGRNVVLGLGANIFENVTIGENSIIGAGSLVTKDIPENMIAYGIPAKVVKEIS